MVRLRFLGHAAWFIEGEKVKIVIDPFLTGNPLAPLSAKELSVDYVIVTHAHSDHTGDAELIQPKYAIPMHYNTFDLIKADPRKFVENLPKGVEGVILNPGETFELKG